MPPSTHVDLTHLGSPGCLRAALALLVSAALIVYWLLS
jgi:hypothetical protein